MVFGILAQNLSEVDPDAWLQQVNSNLIHPLAFVIFVIAAAWLFIGPRGKVAWSVLMVACFISVAQRFSVITMDFNFMRAIGTLALIRMLTYGELRTIRPHVVDKLMLAFVVSIVVMTAIREGPSGAVPKAGNCLDWFSMYWVGRSSLRTMRDIRLLMAALGVMVLPVAIFFIIEQLTGRNHFSIFGGVSPLTQIRDGKLRAQGSFCHPIIAGVFFACFTPLAIGIILSKVRGISAFLGGWFALTLSLITILMTNSSTPVAGVLVGLMAWATFKFRSSLKSWMYIVIFLMVIGHFGSTHGIHHVVFTRIDFTGSSSGYHRYLLVDGLIDNLTQWGFYGDRTPGYNRSFRDITNMYVVSAITGGLIALVLHLSLVYQAFKATIRGVRHAVNREELMMMYGLGCSFAAIYVSFTAVACYGEGIIPCYMILGCGISTSQTLAQRRLARVSHPKQKPNGQQPVGRTSADQV